MAAAVPGVLQAKVASTAPSGLFEAGVRMPMPTPADLPLTRTSRTIVCANVEPATEKRASNLNESMLCITRDQPDKERRRCRSTNTQRRWTRTRAASEQPSLHSTATIQDHDCVSDLRTKWPSSEADRIQQQRSSPVCSGGNSWIISPDSSSLQTFRHAGPLLVRIRLLCRSHTLSTKLGSKDKTSRAVGSKWSRSLVFLELVSGFHDAACQESYRSCSRSCITVFAALNFRVAGLRPLVLDKMLATLILSSLLSIASVYAHGFITSPIPRGVGRKPVYASG